MKKVILAAGALIASTAVLAQSNASIYGTVDVGYQSYNTGATRITRAVDSGLSTGHIGFRGSEAMGSGVTTTFAVEGALSPMQGNLGTVGGSVFNRDAYLGVGHAAFGEVRVGRQNVTVAPDVDLMVSQAGNFGLHAVNGTAVELGAYQSNVVKYISPKFAGLQVQVGAATGNNTGTTAEASQNQKGVSVSYEIGAARAYAGYQRNSGATSAAERNFKVFGGSYDFGVASVGLSHAQGDVSTVGTSESKTTMASVKMPLGSGIAVHGLYAVANDATQRTDGRGRGYALAVTKELSKRTSTYVAYSSVNNDANSSMFMAGTSAPVAAGQDPRATTVGVKHSF